MYKLYNTQSDIASKIYDFLIKCGINKKTQLNIIPFIVFGMISSESTVSADIAKNLKDDFSLIQHESVIKRIKRFFSNKLFDPFDFYDKIIHYVISNYKTKHSDNRVHIIFDHMFSHDNYTVFMISMRIGTQGIPLWFRCFEGKDNPKAFDEELIKEGITYVSNLFSDDFELIFLADRWFNSTSLMEHINSLNQTYCIRLKGNIKITYFNNRLKENVTDSVGNIKSKTHSSKYFNDITITTLNYKTNVVIGKKKDINEPWIIVTNGDVSRAIKDYSYRFGGIETLFKNQKSNGMNIQSTVNASIKYFENMYTITCFAILYLTILGADYSKNTKCYKNVSLTTHKKFKDGIKRVMSLFNIGLTLFHLAFNSYKYIRLPFTFKLYDI